VVEAPLFRATGALFPQEQVGTTFRTFFDEHLYVRGWCDRHPETKRSYVDIGAGDGIDMSNTFELARAGWAGVCLEGYPLRFAQLAQTYRSLPRVTLVRAYVSPKNVGSLLQGAGVDRSVPVLNLDIDSCDLHVARALMEVTRPRLMIVEWNDLFPPPLKFSVSWDPEYRWDGGSFFQGASLAAWGEFAEEYDYRMTEVRGQALFLEDSSDPRVLSGKTVDGLWAEHLSGPVKWITSRPHELEHIESLDPSDMELAVRSYFAQFGGRFELGQAQR